jgi:hypothetical protein
VFSDFVRFIQMRGEQLMSHSASTSINPAGGGQAQYVQVEADNSFINGYEVDIQKRWKRQPPNTSEQEFTSMRYLPVLPKDPIEFVGDGYKLRPAGMNRRIKFVINITMYNEESHEMNDTLQAVCDNLEYMQSQMPSNSRPIWQQAAIIIVSDGRTKMNKGTKEWMTDHGMFDEDAMTVYEQGLPSQPQMHVFENTSQLEVPHCTHPPTPPTPLTHPLADHSTNRSATSRFSLKPLSLRASSEQCCRRGRLQHFVWRLWRTEERVPRSTADCVRSQGKQRRQAALAALVLLRLLHSARPQVLRPHRCRHEGGPVLNLAPSPLDGRESELCWCVWRNCC